MKNSKFNIILTDLFFLLANYFIALIISFTIYLIIFVLPNTSNSSGYQIIDNIKQENKFYSIIIDLQNIGKL